MIRAPFSLDDLDVMANDFFALLESEISISTKIANRPHDLLTPVFDYISLNLKQLISGQPYILELRLTNIVPLVTASKIDYGNSNPGLSTRSVDKWFKSQLLSVFDYDNSSTGFAKKYSGTLAYEHAAKLSLITCPYCNAQFTFTIKKKDYKTRPHFDHFISKSKHPYFALSFYNLIPACFACNSNLKGSKNFLSNTHLHPYLEGIEGVMEFKTNISAVDYMVNKSDFTISATPCKGANPQAVIRAKKSLKDFAIEDRYNHHKDYIGEIITKAYFYNDSTINELFENYKKNGVRIFNSRQEIIEMLMGNFIHEDNLHRRILSKITKDISKEVGLLL